MEYRQKAVTIGIHDNLHQREMQADQAVDADGKLT